MLLKRSHFLSNEECPNSTSEFLENTPVEMREHFGSPAFALTFPEHVPHPIIPGRGWAVQRPTALSGGLTTSQLHWFLDNVSFHGAAITDGEAWHWDKSSPHQPS